MTQAKLDLLCLRESTSAAAAVACHPEGVVSRADDDADPLPPEVVEAVRAADAKELPAGRAAAARGTPRVAASGYCGRRGCCAPSAPRSPRSAPPTRCSASATASSTRRSCATSSSCSAASTAAASLASRSARAAPPPPTAAATQRRRRCATCSANLRDHGAAPLGATTTSSRRCSERRWARGRASRPPRSSLLSASRCATAATCRRLRRCTIATRRRCYCGPARRRRAWGRPARDQLLASRDAADVAPRDRRAAAAARALDRRAPRAVRTRRVDCAPLSVLRGGGGRPRIQPQRVCRRLCA